MEKPANYGATWTDGERELLERRFRDGEPLEALATAHGRTAGAVAGQLARQRLVVNFEGVIFAVTRDQQGEIERMDRYADLRRKTNVPS